MPVISVIVPVYNVEKYLGRCLDSILNQTFTDFEVICVNDGTQDNSGAILQEYTQKDPRITIINQENQGLSMARNSGLKIAQGEYILFVDSDDAIEKQLLEVAYGTIVKYHADMVCWDYQQSDGTTKTKATFAVEDIVIRNISILNEVANNTLGCTLLPMVWLYLYRKEFIQNTSFIPNIYHEDEVFTFSLLGKAPKIMCIDARLYLYTYNMNSIMRQQPTIKHFQSLHIVIEQLYSLYSPQSTKKFACYMVSRHIPRYIQLQCDRITRQVPISEQLPLWRALEEQLKDLKAKGILNEFEKNKNVCRLARYIVTHGAQAYYEKEILYWHKKPFHVMKTNALVADVVNNDIVKMATIKAYYIFGIKIFSKEKLDLKRRKVFICGLTISYASRK